MLLWLSLVCLTSFLMLTLVWFVEGIPTINQWLADEDLPSLPKRLVPNYYAWCDYFAMIFCIAVVMSTFWHLFSNLGFYRGILALLLYYLVWSMLALLEKEAQTTCQSQDLSFLVEVYPVIVPMYALAMSYSYIFEGT